MAESEPPQLQGLAALPPELLDQIVTYLPSACSVSHLGRTSRNIHSWVEKSGWRTFTHARFPSSQTADLPPDWKGAGHALSSLKRNWDRRAFIARYIEPGGRILKFPGGKESLGWKRPRGQTMGFQPQIDAYETWTGGRWEDKREVLAWSAGAELVVRVKEKESSGNEAGEEDTWDTRLDEFPQQKEGFDAYGNKSRWWTYKPLSAVEGRDDITSVSILKPYGLTTEAPEEDEAGEDIILSTANGDLQRLAIPLTQGSPDSVVQTYFVTNGLPVRSASVSPAVCHADGSNQLLVANLSDTRVALYPITDSLKIAASSNVNGMPQTTSRGARIWSTKFTDSKHVAVGLGPSVEPLHVYEVREDGLSPEPVRRFGLSADSDAIDFPGTGMDGLGTVKPSSSVYPTEALMDASSGKPSPGLFLSGAYDGIIRLHDLRSPHNAVKTYHDPTDDSAIYSLLSRGHDRIIAGTARHSLLKIFDLRMTSSLVTDYTSTTSSPSLTSASVSTEEHTQTKGNWNIFINPRTSTSSASSRGGPNAWMRRSAESSIYSLASPSPFSSIVYAGVENACVEFNFSAVLDPWPEPGARNPFLLSSRGSASNASTNGFMNGDQRQKERTVGVGKGRHRHRNQQQQQQQLNGYQHQQTLEPRRLDAEVLNLAMYAQGTDGSTEAMKLRVQRSVQETLALEKRTEGLDERWKDAAEG